MEPLPADHPRAKNEAVFSQLVARAFAQRRKMLRRSLGDWAALLNWEAAAVEPTARAETLSVAQFIALADQLFEAGISG